MNTQTNTDQEKAFFSAVKRGDIEEVKKMAADSPALLRACNYAEFGGPCLNLAGGHRHNLDMVKVLIDLGADVNQKSDWWAGPWSPTLLALNYNDNTVTEYLISRGAEVDVHIASGLGNLDRLKELLDRDPELLEARGGDGCMPLHCVGTPEAVDLLVDRGADLEARDIDHYSTPVQWAAWRPLGPGLRLLERGAQPDIFSAVMSGAADVVRELIAADPDVLTWRINQQHFPPGPDHEVMNIMTFTIGNEATPLHAAAIGNKPDMIRLLVECGQDPNIPGGYDECTPLHMAAWHDHVEAATALLDAGAAMEQESGELHENTPMGWAIVAGSVRVAALLLDRGCAIRPYYASEIEKALAGGFKEYTNPAPGAYEQIAELLARGS